LKTEIVIFRKSAPRQQRLMGQQGAFGTVVAGTEANPDFFRAVLHNGFFYNGTYLFQRCVNNADDFGSPRVSYRFLNRRWKINCGQFTRNESDGEFPALHFGHYHSALETFQAGVIQFMFVFSGAAYKPRRRQPYVFFH